MLNLCRLTEAEGESKEGGELECSLETLTRRINGLLAGTGELQKGKGDS